MQISCLKALFPSHFLPRHPQATHHVRDHNTKNCKLHLGVFHALTAREKSNNTSNTISYLPPISFHVLDPEDFSTIPFFVRPVNSAYPTICTIQKYTQPSQRAHNMCALDLAPQNAHVSGMRRSEGPTEMPIQAHYALRTRDSQVRSHPVDARHPNTIPDTQQQSTAISPQ